LGSGCRAMNKESRPSILKRTSRNFRAMIFRGSYYAFFDGLSRDYGSLYLFSHGLNVIQIGIVRSMGMLATAFTSAFLGVLADVRGRRKAFIVIILLEILGALLYAVAWNGCVAALASMVYSSSSLGAMIIGNIALADSLPMDLRATGLGVSSTVTQVSSLASPIIAGIIVSMYGGISIEGIRPLYVIQLAGLALMAVPFIHMFREEVKIEEKMSFKDGFTSAINLLRSTPWLQRWVLIEILGGYVWSTTMPYYMIYISEIDGADPITIGLMGFALNLALILGSIPIGRLADRIGRVKTILLLRPLFYLSTLMILYFKEPYLLILAWALRGLFRTTSSAFGALTMELVPENMRGRWTSIRSFIRFLTRLPAPVLGGYLWTMLSPQSPFLLAIAVDLFLRVPLIYMTPETLRHE